MKNQSHPRMMFPVDCSILHGAFRKRFNRRFARQRRGDVAGLCCSLEGGVFEEAEQFRHHETGRQVRTFRAWSYEPSTQTATVQTVWEEIDADGRGTDRWESGPIRIHCVFRFEIEHLLNLAGYDVEAVYGDFFRGELTDESEEMVWVARG